MAQPRNIKAFLFFRLFFNARFYYPVLAVFFVDLGLTLDQYAILNVAWAASIVCFELPLGAVADKVGRRPLVVGAAALMIVEMAVMAFAPTGNPTLLFALFLVNRILSGLAEAAASGADEALAYDTLVARKRTQEWPSVLGHLQRLTSAGFLVSMVVGAAVYDADLMTGAVRALGFDGTLDQVTTARFPVYLTLVLSFLALASALAMREVHPDGEPAAPEGLRASLRGIADAGRWIRATRFVLMVILFSLVLDSVVRLFLTIASSYYRMAGIPERIFGVLGAAFAALGFFTPGLAKALLRRCAPVKNFGVVAILVTAGLFGTAFVHSWPGAFAVALQMAGFHLLMFFSSHYLNQATASSRRATVLSFKSLAGNLAYGAVGILYAALYRGLAGGEGEEVVLARTLLWLPVALVAVIVPLLVWALKSPRMCRPEA